MPFVSPNPTIIATTQQHRIFLSPEWLNATCGERSYEVVSFEDTPLFAFQRDRKFGFVRRLMPPLTPCYSFGFEDAVTSSPSGYYARINKLSEVLERLRPGQTSLCLHFPEAYVLPFYRAGCQVSARTVYRYNDLQRTDPTTRFNRNLRRALKRPLPDHSTFRPIPPEEAYPLFTDLLHERGVSAGLSKATFVRICTAFAPSAAVRLRGIHHAPSGTWLAALMTVLDGDRVYALYNYRNATLDVSGNALQHLYRNEIEHYRAVGTEVFDFNGSMLPGVEPFLRSFGGERGLRYAVNCVYPKQLRAVLTLLNRYG